jgi:ribosomal protein S6
MFTVIYETINGQRITRTVRVQALLNKVISSIHNNGGTIITVERKG